ncbi:MAG TPA: FKBP-type peptidyl-prolyl cis-trans isomerase [Myxococcota bacterium]|nr:FKBP-type peptidyl-prolyl cis-trans isomerase [Myxococcota bacterium]
MNPSRFLPLLALAALLSPAPAPRADDVGSASPPVVRRFTRVPAPDGIQIRRYNKTDGPRPGPKDTVLVHYEGTLEDGTVFDSTLRQRRPAALRLDKVIPCWKVALTRLREGEKAQVICPAEVAYGAKGSPPSIPSNARLTFEIELIDVL